MGTTAGDATRIQHTVHMHSTLGRYSECDRSCKVSHHVQYGITGKDAGAGFDFSTGSSKMRILDTPTPRERYPQDTARLAVLRACQQHCAKARGGVTCNSCYSTCTQVSFRHVLGGGDLMPTAAPAAICLLPARWQEERSVHFVASFASKRLQFKARACNRRRSWSAAPCSHGRCGEPPNRRSVEQPCSSGLSGLILCVRSPP